MAFVSSGQLGAAPQAAPPARIREQRRTKGGGRTLGRVDVHQTCDGALPAWSELEKICPGSAYQTRGWLRAWMDTIGRACDAQPMLIVAHNRDRLPVAFLPFATISHDRLRIAGFLGGRDSNANLGLFRPGVRFSEGDLQSLFRAAAVKIRPRPDAFVLANQPEQWEGVDNPLAQLPRQPSPSFCHATTLSADFAAYVAGKLSTDSRKKLAKKRKRLEKDLGTVRHLVASDAEQAQTLLDAFFAQKLARFEQLGIESEFEHPSARAFLEQASFAGLETGEPPIELHGLIAGERIVATYGGSRHRQRFHAMFNSFDMAEDAARCSPGDLLLVSMLEQMSAQGVESFDLGVGEARYKQAWCERAEPLFDTIVPISAKGRAFALAEAARLRVKRHIKQNPYLWSLAQRLRAAL
jgi:CelD/BcsL family acetyltransferase involved in cellulose biosynthesis